MCHYVTPSDDLLRAETGYQYLRARYYDPTTGQFTTRDPLTPITRSPHAYVGSNPLNLVDPAGLHEEEITAEDIADTLAVMGEVGGWLALGAGLAVFLGASPWIVLAAGSAVILIGLSEAIIGGIWGAPGSQSEHVGHGLFVAGTGLLLGVIGAIPTLATWIGASALAVRLGEAILIYIDGMGQVLGSRLDFFGDDPVCSSW